MSACLLQGLRVLRSLHSRQRRVFFTCDDIILMIDHRDVVTRCRRSALRQAGGIRTIVEFGVLAIACLVTPTIILGQQLRPNDAASFVRALIREPGKTAGWIDGESNRMAQRLQIEYEGVPVKSLIGYDLDDSVKNLIKAGRLDYAVSIDSLDSTVSRLVLKVGGQTHLFYFRSSKIISPLAYLTTAWTHIESDHFRFHLSDSTLFNAYCIARLEQFLVSTARMLGLNDAEMRRLQTEKVDYYLCRDEDEIERLTGFRVRGMYNLAFDAIVTTFSTHFHELAHLLMNYKLSRLPLYTHPFLQEGFAAGVGGRGGIDADVLLSLGDFLWRSQSIDLPTLLSREAFDQTDASITYPAAGLFNRFLLHRMGAEQYLLLYRRHSGRAGDSAVGEIFTGEVGADSEWQAFLSAGSHTNAISLGELSTPDTDVYEDRTSRIGRGVNGYSFLLSGVVLLGKDSTNRAFMSKTFRELFPDSIYGGQKFLIRARDEEISVYNLLTNTLVGNYAASFSIPPTNVPRIGERFSFRIRKDAFDRMTDSMFVKTRRP